ncbi:MAG: hypothetical protein KIH63_005515 [Candidatus Saccharibacteria bacterium]|nr:hypothetical protein [Candidatus Saccharibacteria bacterium]
MSDQELRPGVIESVPSRAERLQDILDRLALLPPAQNGLEAYAQMAELINTSEDALFGDHWDLPRTFLDGRRTDRLYPILPESFFSVPAFPGVTLMVSKVEVVFMSRWGAIEMQTKDPDDKFGERIPFCSRFENVIFSKPDALGDGVWHDKNRF